MTGNRSGENPKIDVSRCLRMRFCESGCHRCLEACHHGAITLDDALAVNPDKCQGCLLCTVVCPSGALEDSGDFYDLLARLSNLPEPVLGCIRTENSTTSSLTCLGGLSDEHLLALCHSIPDKLTLNLTLCADCVNKAAVSHLRLRLSALSVEGLLASGESIVFEESKGKLPVAGDSMNRRGFFKSLGSSIFRSSALLMQGRDDEKEIYAGYSEKRLPVRRKLLNETARTVPESSGTRIRRRFNSVILINSDCTACQGCVAACPTGALNTAQPDAPPRFNEELCTGCALCSEFCLESAITVSSPE